MKFTIIQRRRKGMNDGHKNLKIPGFPRRMSLADKDRCVGFRRVELTTRVLCVGEGCFNGDAESGRSNEWRKELWTNRMHERTRILKKTETEIIENKSNKSKERRNDKAYLFSYYIRTCV